MTHSCTCTKLKFRSCLNAGHVILSNSRHDVTGRREPWCSEALCRANNTAFPQRLPPLDIAPFLLWKDPSFVKSLICALPLPRLNLVFPVQVTPLSTFSKFRFEYKSLLTSAMGSASQTEYTITTSAALEHQQSDAIKGQHSLLRTFKKCT